MKHILFFLVAALGIASAQTGGPLTVTSSGQVSGPVSAATFLSANGLPSTIWTTIDASMVNTTGTDGNPAFALVPGNNYIIDQLTSGAFELALPDPTAQAGNARIYLRDANNSVGTSQYVFTNDSGGTGFGSLWYQTSETDLSATSNVAAGANQAFGDMVLQIAIDSTPQNMWSLNNATEAARLQIPSNSKLTLGTSSTLTAPASTTGQVVVQPGSETAGFIPQANGSGGIAWNGNDETILRANGTIGVVGSTTGSGVLYRLTWPVLESAVAGNYGGLYFDIILADSAVTSQTGANSSITTYAGRPSDWTYEVAPYVNVTAISSGSLTMQVTFTDETNTSRTISLFPIGTTTASITTTGFVAFSPATIRSKASTSVTLKTIFSGTSITYDAGGQIKGK